jgi:peptidyl-prolyl cis-trans isomerase SurA
MMKNIFTILSIFFLINCFNFSELRAEMRNTIVAKVGNSLISSVDIQNEIMTNLFLRKEEVSQEKINRIKSYALKNLINKTIKKSEIDKYEVKDFSKVDLQKYIDQTAKKFNTNSNDLIKLFKKNNLDYNSFIEKYKIELLWNTLIYSLYQSQININIIEVENEIKEIKNTISIQYDLSEIEISKSEYNKGQFNEILKIIKNDGFEAAANKFSISASAVKGGRLGWIASEALSAKYLQAINKLAAKEISSPILNENTVSILKINNVKNNKNEIKEEELKQKILIKKKQEKLNLFSRSHFSKLENTITVNFQ